MVIWYLTIWEYVQPGALRAHKLCLLTTLPAPAIAVQRKGRGVYYAPPALTLTDCPISH